MSQINLHVTKEFQDDLALLMRRIRTSNKSDAIRYAVKTIALYINKIAAAEARDRQCAAGVVDTAPDGGAAAGAACAAGAGAAAAPADGGP